MHMEISTDHLKHFLTRRDCPKIRCRPRSGVLSADYFVLSCKRFSSTNFDIMRNAMVDQGCITFYSLKFRWSYGLEINLALLLMVYTDEWICQLR